MQIVLSLYTSLTFTGQNPFTKTVVRKGAPSFSVGATARCGLWPVEKYLSTFPYPSPTLSIFSLPAFEDLFLLPTYLYTQYFKSWKTSCNYQNICLVLFRPSSLSLSSLFLCSTFVTIRFLYVFFWVIPRRLNFISRRFGTSICSIFIGKKVNND
jgi:hypothetical protein